MRCPGQDTRFWKPEDIFEMTCPKCGHQVEFFKDEPSRRCKNCGNRVLNPKMDFGCATYCKFAEQCLGNLPPELLAQRREEMFKNRVAIEMKRYFNRDFKRIGHAAKVARYAEKILQKEKGDPAVVLTAAYLHDIGIKEAEQRYKSNDAAYQEKLGPPVAREILEKLRADPKLIEEVCDIIGHHHPRPQESGNFKIVYDADLLVNMEESYKKSSPQKEKISIFIEKNFLTDAGRVLAGEILLSKKNSN